MNKLNEQKSENIIMSFVTHCFCQVEKVYFDNVKKYSNNNNVEFVFVDLSGESTKIEEYIVTNLFKELKFGKLKYYKRKKSLQNIDLISENNIFHFLCNGKFIYNLLAEHVLDGTEINSKTEKLNHCYLKNTTFNEEYKLFVMNDYKILTCFSVLYNVDHFIDNLINNILGQSIFNNINFVLINLFETNNNNTNEKINHLLKYQNITIINETNDYGLYNMWNFCIQQSNTYFVSNMNPDDIRGSDWAYEQIINFEPSVDLVTPKYIPINNIITHNDLMSIVNPEIWFDNYYYFSSVDMFQYVNNKIQSKCIPNCSPIWRKKIHEDDNYFDESKYGCYADFAVWLKAGVKKYIYKQTDYRVGFYISNNQLHKRQINDKNVFKSLVLKYGNDNVKKIIKLNQKYNYKGDYFS